MNIIRRIAVPTGDILIVKGAHGPLEMVSLGDYGKDVNLNQNRAVENGTPIMPLTKKWVLTISTQYGCRESCTFCDVPRAGRGRNATFGDLTGQLLTGLHLHPEVTTTERLNVHFARMGEPTWNPSVLECARWAKEHLNAEYPIHPVVSTMMPARNEWLRTFIHSWMRIKNRLYGGNAGLQISINSTDEETRETMFRGRGCTLPEIAEVMRGVVPFGRKITLNFAIAEWPIDPTVLLRHFPPEWYICKLTPMHRTLEAECAGIRTAGNYTTPQPYEAIAERLRGAGYEVLVFIASEEEDTSRITCGNAVLSSSAPGKGG